MRYLFLVEGESLVVAEAVIGLRVCDPVRSGEVVAQHEVALAEYVAKMRYTDI